MQQQDQPSPLGLGQARAFIAGVELRFTTASTVREHPHQYIARAWLTAGQQREFDRLVRLINSTGYIAEFWGSYWRYLDLDGRAYWPSQSWYGPDAGQPDTMLNRRRLDDGQLRLEVAR